MANNLDLAADWDEAISINGEDLASAARHLRYLADEFVHKANFVLMQNRIKELEEQLERADNTNVESRSWRTDHVGELAICSTATFRLRDVPDRVAFWLWVYRASFGHRSCGPPLSCSATVPGLKRLAGSLPLGCVVCVVRLVRCQPASWHTAPGLPEAELGDYSPGRYAWVGSGLL